MKAAECLEESQQKRGQLVEFGDEDLEIEKESDITEKLCDWQEKDRAAAEGAAAETEVKIRW